MRFVVFGPGAIGGSVGGQLARAGHQVSRVARGDHARVLGHDGLALEWPGGRQVLRLEVADDPAQLPFDDGTVVLLAVKSQHTEAVLDALAPVAPPQTPVVCLQNGVANERRVLRRFANTYAVCVMCPASHLRPGVVQVHSAPISGLLDIGRYPGGRDDTARAVAEAIESATFESVVRSDIMRWKYTKLLSNLMNAPEALCGQGARFGELADLVRAEGTAVLGAAGIDVASEAEDAERRGDKLALAPTQQGRWKGGSSWQSVARGTGSIEADFLNGEISLLGRLHGVATPVNDRLAALARALVRDNGSPGAMDLDALLDDLHQQAAAAPILGQ